MVCYQQGLPRLVLICSPFILCIYMIFFMLIVICTLRAQKMEIKKKKKWPENQTDLQRSKKKVVEPVFYNSVDEPPSTSSRNKKDSLTRLWAEQDQGQYRVRGDGSLLVSLKDCRTIKRKFKIYYCLKKMENTPQLLPGNWAS